MCTPFVTETIGTSLSGTAGADALPHASRHFPVELAHPVTVAGETNGEHGHAEGFVVVVRIQPSPGPGIR